MYQIFTFPPPEPQPDSPAQLQPNSPAQLQPDSPAQPQPDSPVQEPVPLLTSTPRHHPHKGAAKKPPRSPKKLRREAKKTYFRQLWKDVRNSRESEGDVDDPDGITVAPDNSTNETTAGFSGFPSGDFSGFPSDNDARPRRQRNPLPDIQETATRLQPASSNRISRPSRASEETPVPEGRHVDPHDRTILNLDTPKPAAGTI